MNAAAILKTLEASGLRITVDGADLLVTPPGRMPPWQRDLLKANKPELIAALSAPPRGTAAKLTLDDGAEITLLEMGGTVETARHAAQRTYGERLRSFAALEGIYQAMLDQERSA